MKGLNDFIKDQSLPVNAYPVLTKIFDKSEYSLEKVLEDLQKDYKTILKETKEYSYQGENFFIEMIVNGKSYYMFNINNKTPKYVLEEIVKGLKVLPKTSYFDSKEYQERQYLEDAKARASGFKDSSNLTRAYYEK